MDKHRHVDLNLFLVFDALLRCASVSKASQTLGVSQSAVSHSLKKLRTHFGDQLFLKTREGVAPTDKALALAEDVSRFVAFAQAAMVGPGQFDPSTAERVITLSISDIAELTFVPALLERLAIEAPGCSIRTIEAWDDDLRRGLEQGDIDLTVTARAKPHGDVLQQKLFEHRFVVVAGPGSDLEGEISLEEFSHRRQVVVDPARAPGANVDHVLARQGIIRNAAFTTSHWLIVPFILREQPSYVAVAPRRLAYAHAEFGLKVLKTTFELPKIEVLQFWHRRANADNFNIWLRGVVREVVSRTGRIGDEP